MAVPGVAAPPTARDPGSIGPRRRSIRPNRSTGAARGDRHHEATARVRGPLRTPDPPLEPEDEALHLRRAQRHLHHRPAADARAPAGGDGRRARHRRARRDRALRGHEEAVPGRDPGARRPLRHAVRVAPLAGRAPDQLGDDLPADPPPARAAQPEARGPAGAAADARAARPRGGADQARDQPRRGGRHAAAARRGRDRQPQQGGDRRARGQPPRAGRHRPGQHQLRPGRGDLRRPRQRRRDPLLQPGGGGAGRRHHRGQGRPAVLRHPGGGRGRGRRARARARACADAGRAGARRARPPSPPAEPAAPEAPAAEAAPPAVEPPPAAPPAAEAAPAANGEDPA